MLEKFWLQAFVWLRTCFVCRLWMQVFLFMLLQWFWMLLQIAAEVFLFMLLQIVADMFLLMLLQCFWMIAANCCCKLLLQCFWMIVAGFWMLLQDFECCCKYSCLCVVIVLKKFLPCNISGGVLCIFLIVHHLKICLNFMQCLLVLSSSKRGRLLALRCCFDDYKTIIVSLTCLSKCTGLRKLNFT